VLAALRQTVPAGAKLGVTLDPHPYIGVGADAEQVAELIDTEHNRVYLDPVIRGSYPAEARAIALPDDCVIQEGDLELIGAPIDFLGINYYRPHFIRSGDWSDLRLGETPVHEHPGFVEHLAADIERTVMGWPAVPSALHDLLVRLDRDTAGLPLYITENGCAQDDYIGPAGTIDDYERIAYIHGHLAAAWHAIDEGVNLAGYFHWSLMDNFEWAHGYRRRFGLYYVDFESGRRIPKRSARFYRQLATTSELPSWDETFPADAPSPWAPVAPLAV
jgi:beta-glucosidase